MNTKIIWTIVGVVILVAAASLFGAYTFVINNVKEKIVFVWCWNIPIWVDIEKEKKRGKEIFSLHSENEYQKIWEKNLGNKI